MKYLFFLLSVFLMLGCVQKNKEKIVAEETLSNENALTEGENFETITSKTVVFLFPGNSELNELQEKYEEETYIEIIADLTWYPAIAGERLDSLNINNFESDKEVLVFKKSDQTIIKLIKNDAEGDMVVFHPDKDLLITSSVDFDLELVQNYLQ